MTLQPNQPTGAEGQSSAPAGAPGGAPVQAPAASGRGLRVGVLGLQGAVSEHLAMLRACGATAVEVRTALDLEGLDGLILPGGESTTVGLLLERLQLLEPLRAAVRAGLPTWGTCMGMIMLASRVEDGVPGQTVLGCFDIGVQRNAFGRQVDSCVTPLELSFDPGVPFPGVFIRAPRVLETGSGVHVLARRGEAIVAVRQGRLLGTSFHPELTADCRLHAYFLGLVAEGKQS